jgi:hypothetical protein
VPRSGPARPRTSGYDGVSRLPAAGWYHDREGYRGAKVVQLTRPPAGWHPCRHLLAHGPAVADASDGDMELVAKREITAIAQRFRAGPGRRVRGSALSGRAASSGLQCLSQCRATLPVQQPRPPPGPATPAGPRTCSTGQAPRRSARGRRRPGRRLQELLHRDDDYRRCDTEQHAADELQEVRPLL